MSTMWELTIDFKLITGSGCVATALFTYPLDLHVEGVSPGHVVDGQKEDAVTGITSLRDTLSNSVFASFPNQ